MAKEPIAINVTRREHARSRAKRYLRFFQETTVGLLKVRKRRRDHHNALLDMTARVVREEEVIQRLRKLFVEEPTPRIETAIAASERHIQKARARMEKLAEAIEADNAQIQNLKTRSKRAFTKRRHFLKRARFFAVKVRHLKKLKEQQEKEQPTFEPWMANGADYQDASEGAKAFIARAVVLHGLTCTSMARNFVPAGGSTTSYHLIWNGGRAGDAAGSMDRMEACQRAEYQRGLGLPGQLEMFGPINDRCLKLGSSLALAEGEPLETLHDSHVHGAEEDSAVEAALHRK